MTEQRKKEEETNKNREEKKQEKPRVYLSGREGAPRQCSYKLPKEKTKDFTGSCRLSGHTNAKLLGSLMTLCIAVAPNLFVINTIL